MKNLLWMLTLLPVLAPAQEPAYVDPGMKTMVQVAIVCRDIEATSKRWAAVLGVEVPRSSLTRPGRETKAIYRGHPTEGQAKLAFIKTGQITLELIQPVGKDTSWQDFLDANGEGVQHVAFQVMDLDRTIQSFEQAGALVLHRGRYDNDNGSYVYMDTRKMLGVTVELLHSDPKK